MRILQPALKLGTVDTGSFRGFLEAQSADVWHFSCDHIPTLKACRRIILRHSKDYDFDLAHVVDWPAMDLFRPLIEPILEVVCSLLKKQRVAAAFIAHLPPGGEIFPHVDHGEFLTIPSRVHIPIKTNSDVLYRIGGCLVDDSELSPIRRHQFAECYHFAEGEIWEIDNTSYHSVENRGLSERWHLILNIW